MTAPKPKPKPNPEPEPDPPEPGPDEDESPIDLDKDYLRERVDALFASQVALIERVDKLEERLTTPVGIGKRP